MKTALTFFLAIFITGVCVACTTFCINKDGHIVFGRNYDWITGAGIIHTNQRGLFKTSMPISDGQPASWVSKYGSTTFNQYGKEFPTGGMNEKGLVVELMWLDETKFPGNDKRPAVGVLQWIQYQLDNSATTADVIASDLQIRITTTSTPLHYLVADAGGNVATIEYLNGKMVVHEGKQLPFPVLTNSTYAESEKAAKANRQVSDNSLERFVKACNMIEEIKGDKIKMPLTDYAFSILNKVAQGDFTKWSIVYDITNKRIHFRTDRFSNIKSFSTAFDYSCLSKPKMYDMNQEGSGDITATFTLPDERLKEKVIRQAVLESRSHVRISEEEQRSLLKYEETVKCN